jgi:hypothetical protein
MGMAEQHREVVVQLRDGADPDYVSGWLRWHGLEAMPLIAGLLAAGEAEVLRAAFGVAPQGALPVPDELAAHVASIVVVPPKQPHVRGRERG